MAIRLRPISAVLNPLIAKGTILSPSEMENDGAPDLRTRLESPRFEERLPVPVFLVRLAILPEDRGHNRLRHPYAAAAVSFSFANISSDRRVTVPAPSVITRSPSWRTGITLSAADSSPPI